MAKNSLCHYTGCTSSADADNYINPQGKTAGQITIVPCLYSVCEPAKTVTEQFKLKINLDQVRSNIVFAVDTSGSMKDEINQIRTNITKFVNDIKVLIPKTKIVVIGSEFTYPNAPILTVLPAPYEKNKAVSSIYWHYNYVDSFQKLDSILNAFDLADYYNFLGAGERLVPALPLISKLKELQSVALDDATVAALPVYIKDADFHFVIVSDDNESQIRLDQPLESQIQVNYLMLNHFLQKMDSVLKINNNTFKIHAIHEKAGFNQSCVQTNADIFHHPYPEAVSKTQGGAFDICQTNWSSIFQKLTENVTGEMTAVDLAKCQSKNRVITEVKVTGGGKPATIIPASDYSYYAASDTDGNPPRVVIDPAKLKNKGFDIFQELTIDIKYTMQ